MKRAEQRRTAGRLPEGPWRAKDARRIAALEKRLEQAQATLARLAELVQLMRTGHFGSAIEIIDRDKYLTEPPLEWLEKRIVTRIKEAFSK